MNRLRAESGFTLMEVLVAMVAGMVVLLAAFSLMDVTLRRTAAIDRRVDTSQRGRFAMDEVTRTLRSQVCRVTDGASEPAIIAGTPTSVTLHRDFSDASLVTSRPPEKVEIALVGTSLLERIFVGTGTSAAPSYPAAPTRTRLLLEDVAREGAEPIFAYYAFDAGTPPRPDERLTAVDAANAGAIARIQVRYVALPRGADVTSRQRLTLVGDVLVRHLDPNDAAPRPKCI